MNRLIREATQELKMLNMDGSDLIILFATVVMLFFAHFSKRWSIISPIVFIIFLFAENQIVKAICFVAILILIILDAKHRGKDSVFLKYNIYSKDCILSKKMVLIISLIGVLCSIVAVVGMLIGR